jgi:hypothetical protein
VHVVGGVGIAGSLETPLSRDAGVAGDWSRRRLESQAARGVAGVAGTRGMTRLEGRGVGVADGTRSVVVADGTRSNGVAGGAESRRCRRRGAIFVTSTACDFVIYYTCSTLANNSTNKTTKSCS